MLEILTGFNIRECEDIIESIMFRFPGNKNDTIISAQFGRLFKLQKRAARMIYYLPTRTPTKPLLKKLGWMPLSDRVQYRKSLMVNKFLECLASHNTLQKCISFTHVYIVHHWHE